MKWVGFVALSVGVLGTVVNATLAAPVQWRINEGGNGHWYEAVSVTSRISWYDASDAATAAGGYLVTLTSAEENAFVFSLIDSLEFWLPYLNGQNPSCGPAIGLFQPAGSEEPGGGWQWVTGESFSYSSWASGEPSDGGTPGSEETSHVLDPEVPTRSPTWNDVDGNIPFLPGYIIEYACFKPIPGDLNIDGSVDSADLDIVRTHWNQTVPPGDLASGDADADGNVGSGDLDIVRGNWGAGMAAAAPEPGGMMLGVAMLLSLFMGRRAKTLAVLSLVAGVCLVGSEAESAEYGPGFVWSLTNDFTPGTVHGAYDGNPMPDSNGQPTWSCAIVPRGEPLGTATPWYSAPSSLLSWDSDWFGIGSGGSWAQGDDIMPHIMRYLGSGYMGVVINNSPSYPYHELPILRWTNPTGNNILLSITGEMNLAWASTDSVASVTDVDLVIARWHEGVYSEFLATTISKPHPDTSLESIALPVDLERLQIESGDQIVLSIRPRVLDGPEHSQWLGLHFQNLAYSIPLPPVPVIEPSFTQILLGEEITFDATNSYHTDPDRTIDSYLWDFNDGTPTVDTALAPHIFDTLGEYEISLTVWDDGDPALSDTAYHTIQVVAELIPGDLNRDGFVNSADLDIVRNHWNQTVPPGDLASGDASGDGYVGSGDLDIVRGNWGAGMVVPVPEPGVTMLFGVGFGCLCMAMRRRGR